MVMWAESMNVRKLNEANDRSLGAEKLREYAPKMLAIVR